MAKSKEAVNRTRDAYKAELQDLNRYNPQVRLNRCSRKILLVSFMQIEFHPQYVENMTEVFERCQMSEAQRLQKFKETLFSLQKVLNVSEYEE